MLAEEDVEVCDGAETRAEELGRPIDLVQLHFGHSDAKLSSFLVDCVFPYTKDNFDLRALFSAEYGGYASHREEALPYYRRLAGPLLVLICRSKGEEYNAYGVEGADKCSGRETPCGSSDEAFGAAMNYLGKTEIMLLCDRRTDASLQSDSENVWDWFLFFEYEFVLTLSILGIEAAILSTDDQYPAYSWDTSEIWRINNGFLFSMLRECRKCIMHLMHEEGVVTQQCAQGSTMGCQEAEGQHVPSSGDNGRRNYYYYITNHAPSETNMSNGALVAHRGDQVNSSHRTNVAQNIDGNNNSAHGVKGQQEVCV